MICKESSFEIGKEGDSVTVHLLFHIFYPMYARLSLINNRLENLQRNSKLKNSRKACPIIMKCLVIIICTYNNRENEMYVRYVSCSQKNECRLLSLLQMLLEN